MANTPNNTMKYWEILEECISIAKEREKQHAPIDINYANLCSAYKQLTGKEVSNVEFNEFMMALKLGRIASNHDLEDNYIDLINYIGIHLAFKREEKK